MSAIDRLGGPALAHPVSGEVIEWDDLDAIKQALDETENYLRRPEVRRMWSARDALLARLGELEPITLPRRSRQTDKQRRVELCPRCRKRYQVSEGVDSREPDAVLPEPPPEDSGSDSEAVHSPLPLEEADLGAAALAGANMQQPSEPEVIGGHGAQGDPATADSTGHETPADLDHQAELMPRGQRTPEQEAALGIDIFGAPTDESPAGSQETGPGDVGGASPGSFDPVLLAGELEITSGDGTVTTVAKMVRQQPEQCLTYMRLGNDERLVAAITTYVHAVRPDLLEDT